MTERTFTVELTDHEMRVVRLSLMAYRRRTEEMNLGRLHNTSNNLLSKLKEIVCSSKGIS